MYVDNGFHSEEELLHHVSKYTDFIAIITYVQYSVQSVVRLTRNVSVWPVYATN